MRAVEDLPFVPDDVDRREALVRRVERGHQPAHPLEPEAHAEQLERAAGRSLLRLLGRERTVRHRPPTARARASSRSYRSSLSRSCWTSSGGAFSTKPWLASFASERRDLGRGTSAPAPRRRARVGLASTRLHLDRRARDRDGCLAERSRRGRPARSSKRASRAIVGSERSYISRASASSAMSRPEITATGRRAHVVAVAAQALDRLDRTASTSRSACVVESGCRRPTGNGRPARSPPWPERSRRSPRSRTASAGAAARASPRARRAGARHAASSSFVETRLHHLEVPVAELAPDERVQIQRHVREVVARRCARRSAIRR